MIGKYRLACQALINDRHASHSPAAPSIELLKTQGIQIDMDG
jgi:hypothetical protein